MPSFIIANNALVAQCREFHASGEVVRFSAQLCAEKIDASREFNLVNARAGKISNAKKWAAVASRIEDIEIARQINPGEFRVL